MSDEDERDDAQDESTDGGAESTGSSDETGSPDETGSDGKSGSDDAESSSTTSDSDDSAGAAANPYDGDAPAAAATGVAATHKTSKGTSAGARLAAAKAAKAASKAAKKQQRRDDAGASQSAAERDAQDQAQVQSAEEVLKESPLGRAATRAGEWTQSNRQLALGLAGVALVGLIGWLGWTFYTTSQAASAGALLADALTISSAEIVTPDATAEETDHADDDADEDDAPTFESLDARNEAALTAYRRVSSEYGSSEAATWARLGEGRTLLSQGEYGDARTAYQAAFDASGDESVVAWQALEGIGATYEAESDWAHATSTYERLAALNEHAYESVANYHLARMHAASDDESAALASFRELVETLREDGDEGEPPFPYVLAQADQRLRELDPSAQGAGPRLGGGGGEEGGGGSGIDGMTPEQIQELIQRLQHQGGAGGAPPAPPE